MSKKMAVVVVSGGMDSITLAHDFRDAGYDTTFISFDYGQRHKKELEFAAYWANNFGSVHHIVDLSGMTALISNSALTNPDIQVPDGNYDEDSMRSTVVPNRNAMMISIATALAVNIGADCVAVGIHSGDHAVYPDCRPRFLTRMNFAMQDANTGLTVPGFGVRAPFVYMTKTQICKLGSILGVDWTLTWSCYKGGSEHCGECGTCRERKEAFDQSGVYDPTVYLDPRRSTEY